MRGSDQVHLKHTVPDSGIFVPEGAGLARTSHSVVDVHIELAVMRHDMAHQGLDVIGLRDVTTDVLAGPP